MTPKEHTREGAGKVLLESASAGLRRATLIPVLLLVPLIFLPLRTPAELLASRSVNVALHLAVTLLVFSLVRRLDSRALVAPATALLFAVHPVHVETIAIPSARTELLATVLSLTALLGFTYAGPWRVAGRTVVPVIVAVLAYLALSTAGLSSSQYPAANAGEAGGAASALALLARQVGSLFYPVNLAAHPGGTPPEARTDLLQPLPLLGLAVLAGLLWLALRPYLGNRRDAGASPASFAAQLFLISYVVVAARASLAGIAFTERDLYLPSVGFCLLLAMAIGAVSTGWAPGAQRRPLGPASGRQVRLAALTLAALILGFSILTWARCLEWRGERTNQETTSRAIRAGENGSSSSGLFPSTIHRVR